MSKFLETDVCIIGAGPSGTATSIMLYNLKIKHCIIDKAIFPRDKTCGDGLILYAYKSLKLLGNDLFEKFLKNDKFIHSKKIKLHVDDDINVTFKETANRDMVISYAKRLDFDEFLVNNLSKKYTTTLFGNGVKSLQEQKEGVLIKQKNGDTILAKMVVGADGVKSVVSRQLGQNKVDRKYSSTFVSAYFKDVKNMPKANDAEIRIIHKKMPLFFYIFPLADGSANVSLGGRADRLKKFNINLIDEIEDIITTHKKVKNKFNNAQKIGAWRGWSIPFHFRKQKVVGNRFLLVGDAAGLANAFYKEGVGTGMMSGIKAAKNIAVCKERNSFSEVSLKGYESDLKKEFGKLLTFSFFTLKLVRFKSFFNTTVLLFKKRIEKKSYQMIKDRSY